MTVYDKFPQAAEAARQMGAKVAETPAALAAGVDMILMSLPGPAQLEEVLFGQDGLVQALTADHVVVDTSTVDPATSRANAERVAVSGAAYLDCPILGRPSAAGRWMLPTGGDPQALRYVQPVLLTFAANAVHVGGSGSGNALKLLNQMMFSCINAVSAEVMAICEHTGIDPQVFYDTVANSGAATVSGLFKEVGHCILDGSFEQPAFTVDLLIKDTKLALQMAKDCRAPAAIAAAAQHYNELASADGLGAQDSAAVYKVFRRGFENF